MTRWGPVARSACLLMAAAAAAAGVASAQASPSACPTSGLVVWLNTTGNGAAGSSYYNLEFTNLGRSACALYGYPGVSAVDLAGAQLGRAGTRDAVHRASTVTLAAGATAHAVLRIVDAANYPGSACGQVTAAGIRVYPPGQRAAKVVPFPFAACSRSRPSILSVEAVQKGFGGSAG